MSSLYNYDDILRHYLLKAVQYIITSIENNQMHKCCLYIKFIREHKGVIFPPSLSQEPYVTIVLQNKFFNLKLVNDIIFVILEFNDKYHPISIPLSAILMITDPTRDFYIDFTGEEITYEEEEIEESTSKGGTEEPEEEVTWVDFRRYD